jgi:hypothetical protein
VSTAAAAPPFDPLVQGYPESMWLKMLEGARPWTAAPGPLVVVSPHPDDEILGRED